MKKKLMMVAVLLGALSLGACVDDNESQSVTDLRGAKAAQLEALANLYNAQAEAERIIADAEAALKQAKAQYQAALATAKEQETAQLAEKHAIEIEKLRAQAEEAIALARKNAADYEQDLLDLATERVRALYREYQTALNTMYDYQRRKIELVTNIANAEAELVPAQELAQQNIDDWNKQIKEREYKISLYEEYEGADLTDLKQQYAKAEKDEDVANDAYWKAYAAKDEADNAYNKEVERFYMWNIQDVEKPLATVKAAYELNQNGWYWIMNISQKQLSDTKSIEYYALNPANVESRRQILENELERYTNELGTDEDEADINGSKYANLAYWTEQRAAALEADPDADVTYMDQMIEQLNADIDTWTNIYIKDAQADLDLFESLVASFAGDDLKAYDDAVTALTALADTYEKAYDEYAAAEDALNAAQNKVYTLNTLINQTDVEAEIAQLESEISLRKQWIAYEESNLNYNYDRLIETYNVELQYVNEQIDYQQAIIDSLKEQIDAAVSAEEGTEEPAA